MSEHPDSYLESLGWKWDGCHGRVDPNGDYRVDLSADYGYVWELQRFDDSDRDGVATARWVRMDIDGDTLEELQNALIAHAVIASIAKGERAKFRPKDCAGFADYSPLCATDSNVPQSKRKSLKDGEL